MTNKEFIEWRAKQVAYLPRTRFGRWWQFKMRAFYRWLLEEKP